MKNKGFLYLLILFIGIILLLSQCTKEGPMGPIGPAGENGRSGTVTNYIFYGNGSFIAGTINFNSGIVGKNCYLQIEISDAYSTISIDSPSINFNRGTLSSNVVYSCGLLLYSPSGVKLADKWTNLYSPSWGNTINTFTNIHEVYDYSGISWEIPNLSLYISCLRVDSNGDILSLEIDNEISVIRKYSSSGTLLNTIISNNDEAYSDKYFNIDTSGNIYLAYSSYYYDGTNNYYGVVVKKYNSTGGAISSNFIMKDNNQKNINDIAIDSTGNIFILNSSDAYIYKYDSNFNFITKFGGIGNGSGTFGSSYLLKIAIDSADNIYVNDNGNYLIQKFDNNGNFQSQFPIPPHSGVNIAIDNSDNIYAGEYKYTSTGNQIGVFPYGESVDGSGTYIYGQNGTTILKYNKL